MEREKQRGKRKEEVGERRVSERWREGRGRGGGGGKGRGRKGEWREPEGVKDRTDM